jgi:vanillate O-demethylase ferredoxin subunit
MGYDGGNVSTAALRQDDWAGTPAAATPPAPAEAALARLEVRVHALAWEAPGITSFELRDPHGGALPPFTAGAHIDVHVKPGCVRQYSLCNDPAERHRYVIAPQREEKGRGGSIALHDFTRVGDLVAISAPRNNFALAAGAHRHVLIAGGIGVTPMMAMVAQLERDGADYCLYYCTRARERTAFVERLEPLVAQGKVVLHHDGGDPARGLDLRALLRDVQPGTHVYYCGPAGFMDAAREASSHWPAASVHFEYFTPPAEDAASPPRRPFTIHLERTGLDLAVPADKTIVQVLREHDVFIETSCENGVCGTCLTRYLAGEPEHRDYVLDAADRKEFVMVCCARSKSDVLTLDL